MKFGDLKKDDLFDCDCRHIGSKYIIKKEWTTAEGLYTNAIERHEDDNGDDVKTYTYLNPEEVEVVFIKHCEGGVSTDDYYPSQFKLMDFKAEWC